MLDRLRRDLSYTTRTLRRAPAFTITVVLILGLAIGMSSAMFAAYEQVLLQRLPVAQQDGVVELSGIAGGAASEVPINPAMMQRFRDHSTATRAVAGLAHWRAVGEALTDGDRRLTLQEAVVTDGFFSVLGANPALGRLFRKGDMVQWGANTTGAGVPAVLSHGAWMRAFAGDSSVIGRQLRSPKMSWTMKVVGVAPPGLDYPRGVDLWLAAEYESIDAVARLAPGATAESARQEFQAFLSRDPYVLGYDPSGSLRAQVHTIDQMIVGDARAPLVALSAAVALLLVLACANVGNLALVRAAGRGREMALRRAIGASTIDLIRQQLAESIVIALAGGALGVLLARALLHALVRLAPSGLPRVDMIALAGTPVAIGAVVTGAAVVLFGIVPCFASLRVDLAAPLRADARGGPESRRFRLVRQTLVGSQIALALVVVAGAGLLMRSLARLSSLDMGYATQHLTMLNVSFPWRQMYVDCRPKQGVHTAADSAEWGRCSDAANYAAHERVIANLRGIPGVLAVSVEAVPPFLGSNVWMGRYASQEQSEAESKTNPWFAVDAVGPDFFRALGVPMVAGRAFSDADREDAPRVVVISQAVARHLWPNQSAIGKRLRGADNHNVDSMMTVVGVAADFHYRLHRESTPTVFRPYRQMAAQGYFLVRGRGASVATDALRRGVESAGGGAAFVRAESMDELIAPQLAAPRFDALLLSMFAFAALVLAAVGLYGIMASVVNQQRREIGVRMALGATASEVRNMVLRQAFMVAGAGTVAGLAGAAVGSRLLKSMLFGISPSDPATLAGVAVVLLVVAAASAYLPARRATAIDPALALRSD
jgi:putative ABC transport system permease protein